MKREKYKQLFEVTWEKNEKPASPGAWPATSASATPWTRLQRNPAPALAAGGGRGGRGGIPGRRAHQQHGQPLSVGDALLRAVHSANTLFYPGSGARGRLKPVVDEIALDGSVFSARRCAAGMLVLGGLWTAADAVFLLYYGPAGQLGRELAFLAGGLAIAVAGGLALRQVKALQPQKIPQ